MPVTDIQKQFLDLKMNNYAVCITIVYTFGSLTVNQVFGEGLVYKFSMYQAGLRYDLAAEMCNISMVQGFSLALLMMILKLTLL